MELTDEIYKEITDLTNRGNAFSEQNKLIDALECFNKALDLVPNPKYDWEAATWIYTSLGDIYFMKKEYVKALENLNEALKCPNGFTNPFILLRAGQCFLEMKEIDKAKEYLLKSYMLEGENIFKYEKPKYFNSIKNLITNDKKESKFSLFFKRFKF